LARKVTVSSINLFTLQEFETFYWGLEHDCFNIGIIKLIGRLPSADLQLQQRPSVTM
jgi:hypothetical protein